MILDPFIGMGFFAQGIRLALAPGLRRYIVGPLLINIAVFGALITLGMHYFQTLLDQLMAKIPDWLQWLAPLLWLVFALSLLLVVFYTFSMLANFLAAPFNNALASAVERHLAPATSDIAPEPVTVHTILTDSVTSFAQAGRKLAYLGMRALPLLILSFIPVINVIAAPLWLVFGSWMLALEYLDYPLANRGLVFTQVRAHARERKLMMLGFGGTITLVTMIPLVNFLVMPVAVAGATALTLRHWPRHDTTSGQRT